MSDDSLIELNLGIWHVLSGDKVVNRGIQLVEVQQNSFSTFNKVSSSNVLFFFMYYCRPKAMFFCALGKSIKKKREGGGCLESRSLSGRHFADTSALMARAITASFRNGRFFRELMR
ncbi:MAG: hypothetical protein KAG97_05090 [Victivallales bacterium]|nr:hypothetical protein [Victivallales bacterium]